MCHYSDMNLIYTLAAHINSVSVNCENYSNASQLLIISFIEIWYGDFFPAENGFESAKTCLSMSDNLIVTAKKYFKFCKSVSWKY